MNVRTLHGPPAWLQVVHDHNVSNRIRGRRVAPEPYRRLFHGLLEDLPNPGLPMIIADRFFESPLRVLRELARTSAKAVTIALLGRQGIDRIKTAVASRKSPLSRS